MNYDMLHHNFIRKIYYQIFSCLIPTSDKGIITSPCIFFQIIFCLTHQFKNLDKLFDVKLFPLAGSPTKIIIILSSIYIY